MFKIGKYPKGRDQLACGAKSDGFGADNVQYARPPLGTRVSLIQFDRKNIYKEIPFRAAGEITILRSFTHEKRVFRATNIMVRSKISADQRSQAMEVANNPRGSLKDYTILHADRVSNVFPQDCPYDVRGEDLSWNFESFKKINKLSTLNLELEIIGIDASLVNCLRRIIISEIPVMAIEKVYILNNTGVIVDEVLAQRLGLVPIRADPTQFQYKEGDGDPPTDLNTIVFRLKKVAPGRYKNQSDASDSPISFASTPVYSGDLVWVPQGIQQEKFDNSEIGVVHKNILIAKLAAGHEIELEAHCQKGIGKEHAKWSPATSHYRLMPVITILSPITGDLAYKFQKCFSSGTIEVFKNRKGELEAKVLDASKDTGSREVLRHPEFEGKVLLARKRDHYIFNVESVGSLSSKTIFIESIKVLIKKCEHLKDSLTLATG